MVPLAEAFGEERIISTNESLFRIGDDLSGLHRSDHIAEMAAGRTRIYSLGNLFTSGVNFFIQNPDGSVKLAGATYFFFFVGVLLVTAVLFLFFARFYRGKTYIQDEAEAEPA